ncbi:MAG TPA: intradiol ring-cleavage dioxygenase [Burkholderiaceae bacterium]|nr:intradiol ring-cleavage dioxygenase [Burkholderiaceae bacterium]
MPGSPAETAALADPAATPGADSGGRRRLLLAATSLPLMALPALGRASGGPTRPLTPRQTEGPFYPQQSFFAQRSDLDADLLQVAGSRSAARGTPMALSGQVLRVDGTPVAGALVEIWQCDADGTYLYSAQSLRQGDPGFQGFGRTLTDAQGRYAFRTLRPVPYAGRVPHVHVKVALTERGARRDLLTTQLYLRGDDLSGDFVIRSAPAALRDLLIATVQTTPAEVRARWDIVVSA